MNNKLIKTNTLFYKIKMFFTKMFFKNKFNDLNNTSEQYINKVNSLSSNTLQKQIAESNRQKDLSQKLLNGELATSDLTDTEVDEMTYYFKKDLQELDIELMKIKQHILQMKKQINQ